METRFFLKSQTNIIALFLKVNAPTNIYLPSNEHGELLTPTSCHLIFTDDHST